MKKNLDIKITFRINKYKGGERNRKFGIFKGQKFNSIFTLNYI